MKTIKILLMILSICVGFLGVLNANYNTMLKRFTIALTTCYFEHPNIYKQVLLVDYYSKNPHKINKTKMFELGASIGYDIVMECGDYQDEILAEMIMELEDAEDGAFFMEMLFEVAREIRNKNLIK